MRPSFIHDVPERIVFGVGARHQAAAALGAEGAQRVLIVSSGRYPVAGEVAWTLGSRWAGTFTDVRPHVPEEVAQAARQAAREAEADWVLAIGGGAAIGAAKAVALTEPVSVAAMPTTYAGSERTDIWGISHGGSKQTGRDKRVLPRLVLFDPELTTSLPRDDSLQSLLNAMAHSVEALWSTDATEAARQAAATSLGPLIEGLRGVAADPADLSARTEALYGAYLAATALGGASMALHHKLCHVLGGSFHTAHATTHAVLLPYVIAFNGPAAPGALEVLSRELQTEDPAVLLSSLARDLGVPTHLRALGLRRADLPRAADLAVARPYANPRPITRDAILGLLTDAWHDRRPSVHARRLPLPPTGRHVQPAALEGAPLARAEAAVLAVHGRGADAERFLDRLRALAGTADRGVAWVGLQAEDNTWYPKGFAAPPADNQPWLDDALARLDAAWDALTHHLPPERIAVVGFSQGACLLLTWLGTRRVRPGRVLSFLGAHIDLPVDYSALADLPVWLGCSPEDDWVPLSRVRATEARLTEAGARPAFALAPTPGHAIRPADARALVHALEHLTMPDDPTYLHGYGNALSSEAQPGALPRDQNSPRHVPYGLYAEQINGTGFTAPRALNRRTWMYRLRPQIVDAPWEPTSGGRWLGRFDEGAVSPQVLRFSPAPLPDTPTSFAEGVTTFAGGGDPVARQGMAIHTFAANADMEGALVDLDGDLLVAPWDGRLRIRTELGWLAVGPGEIAILPRGIRFQVHLPDGAARGFLAELFEGHFALPERGPIGANGLADERHFQAPTASYEDRVGPFTILAKQGGAFWRQTAPHSTFDVVAWHGTYAPFKYNLRHFQSLGSTSFDHPDPSLLTVLTAPAAAGGNAVDVAAFLGRWDPTEHTFRPPFFHRNAAVEFNMVLASPTDGSRWQAGSHSYTPYLAPHGVSVAGYRATIEPSDAVADRPQRGSDDSIWLQFESAYTLRLAPWVEGAAHRDGDYTRDFREWPVGELGDAP